MSHNRLGLYILDDNGLAIPCSDLMEWGRWLEVNKFKHHLVDHIAGIRVSTVFLGLDHQYGNGEPILWETMAFNDDERQTTKLFLGKKFNYAPELGQWRFTFKEEAHNFHDKKVKEYKDLLAQSTLTIATKEGPTTDNLPSGDCKDQ